jgi:hypothetical protein
LTLWLVGAFANQGDFGGAGAKFLGTLTLSL